MQSPSRKKLIVQANSEYNKVKSTFPNKQSFILGYILSEYGKLYEVVKGLYMEDQLFDS